MANPQIENGFIRISTELWEAWSKIRINGEAEQMLKVIIRKTYGYAKKEDFISTSQFMQLTGMKRHAIHKSRKKLLNMDLITVTQKGNSKVLSYSFQKDYTKWKVLPKKVTVTQKGNGCNPKRSRSVTQKGHADYNRYIDNIQKIDENIFTMVLDDLNKTIKRQFRQVSKTRQLIKARLDEGFTLDDFKQVHRTMYEKWGRDDKMSQYLRPITLYGTKFESYLNIGKVKEVNRNV